MKKHGKRFLCIILVCMMFVGSVPTAVFAKSTQTAKNAKWTDSTVYKFPKGTKEITVKTGRKTYKLVKDGTLYTLVNRRFKKYGSVKKPKSKFQMTLKDGKYKITWKGKKAITEQIYVNTNNNNNNNNPSKDKQVTITNKIITSVSLQHCVRVYVPARSESGGEPVDNETWKKCKVSTSSFLTSGNRTPSGTGAFNEMLFYVKKGVKRLNVINLATKLKDGLHLVNAKLTLYKFVNGGFQPVKNVSIKDGECSVDLKGAYYVGIRTATKLKNLSCNVKVSK